MLNYRRCNVERLFLFSSSTFIKEVIGMRDKFVCFNSRPEVFFALNEEFKRVRPHIGICL